MNNCCKIGFEKRAVIALVTLLVVRLAGMALIPLNETTEARYGEMARKMLETGNWVTLWHDYGIPFLAKPPLYAWLSAASMGVLGVNEFAARLPSLLLSIGMLALVGYAAFARHGRNAALVTALVLAACPGFFVAAGTVMTDPSLVFCTTLILVSFWQALHDETTCTPPPPCAGVQERVSASGESLYDGRTAFWTPAQGGGGDMGGCADKFRNRYRSRLWGYLFFVGCGVGLLSKGPVALILAGLPVFFWVLIRKQWKPLWQKLPWVSGCLLVLAIALPWYVLAEIRTPGFLKYFIVGENFSRFLDPHWKGDRYGFAHAYPYGMIWLFIVAGILPWCFAPAQMRLIFIQRRDGAVRWCRTKLADEDGWLLFLILWSVSSPVFFTFAANIIWPYCLIMQPGFALLLAEVAIRAEKPYGKFFPLTALVTALAGAVAIVLFITQPQSFAEDQKDVIAAWKETAPAPDSKLIFWSNRMEFSAAFYSGGRARTTQKPADVLALLHDKTHDCIVTYSYNEAMLPEGVWGRFKETGRFTNARGVRILLCAPQAFEKY
jgi:4-amino-4-deoxy-L-arabinose transferase-like glycosyltransferase